MSAWANVATIGKAKNLKGGLLAYAREGLPFLLEEGLEVVFVPPVLKVPRMGRVVSAVPQGGGAYLVHFDTIDSIDLAEKLQDHSCLVRRADVDEEALEGAADLVGFAVQQIRGEVVGKVIALEENPAHALLVVELDTAESEPDDERSHRTSHQPMSQPANDPAGKPSSESGSDSRVARIPLVDAFIIDIDPDENLITVDLPEGLLDL
ncbi:ribosome maturation factor RimM [Anaerotardibacter muris]|uniref:ribosome maturation factor RimM n=1 Tax=Anaerotardibacter muris TaxID=2941505 RepID=UPI002040DD4C|nr:16S rRNA processing protein RimM [Anaerotardibacter muris]